MLISCPECTTKFSVTDTALGDRGRKVRCFKCGETWHQNPPSKNDGAPLSATTQAQASGQTSTSANPAPQRQPTQPLMPPTPTVVAPPDFTAPATPAAPKTAPIADEPAPAPALTQPNVPAPVAAGAPISPKTPEPSVPLESDPLGTDFIAPPPPTNTGAIPLDSDPLKNSGTTLESQEIPKVDDIDRAVISSSGNADIGPSNNDIDFDSLLDNNAEDMPKVFAKRMKKAEKKKGKSLRIFITLLLLLLSIVSILFFMRKDVINRFPESESLYRMVSSMIGVQFEEIGEGLALDHVKSEMTKRGKKHVLIIRGVIINKTKNEREIPLLRLVLLDTNGGVIQETHAKAVSDTLKARGQIGFQIMMEDPSAAAARFEVMFADPPSESAEHLHHPDDLAEKPQQPADHPEEPHNASNHDEHHSHD